MDAKTMKVGTWVRTSREIVLESGGRGAPVVPAGLVGKVLEAPPHLERAGVRCLVALDAPVPGLAYNEMTDGEAGLPPELAQNVLLVWGPDVPECTAEDFEPGEAPALTLAERFVTTPRHEWRGFRSCDLRFLLRRLA